MANITTSEASGFIPAIWAKTALGRLQANITIQRTVTKDSSLKEGEFARMGNTLHIPKRGTLVANTKSANTPITLQNPSSSTVDITLNQHKEVSFLIEDEALAEVNQNVIAGYVEDAAMVLAETVDSYILALYAGVAGGNTVTASTTISDTEVLALRKLFTDNKAPANAPRYAVVSSTQANAMMQVGAFGQYNQLGTPGAIAEGKIGAFRDPNSAMGGFIGRVRGIDFYESQLVPTVGSSPAVSQNLVYTQDAIMFASRPMPKPADGMGVMSSVVTDPESGLSLRLNMGYSIKDQGFVCSLDILFGAAPLRPEHLFLVKANG